MLRRIGIITAVLLIAAAAAARLWLSPEQYPDAVSIKTLVNYQDPALLQRAWALPEASRYSNPPLWQTNPSACGPTSAVNVLRSLGNANATYDDAAAKAGCTFGLCIGGRTLDQLAASLEDPSRKVTVLRDLTVDQLRDELKHANDPNRRYIANFHRGPLFGKGGGHFSPVGGFLEDADAVFVLDVNQSYGPWLVPLERLQQAMNTRDRTSGRSRGLIRIEW
jgi:hypothetical protein